MGGMGVMGMMEGMVNEDHQGLWEQRVRLDHADHADHPEDGAEGHTIISRSNLPD